MADRVVRVILRGQVDGFVSGMRSAGRAVRDTTDQLTSADKKAKEFRTGLTTVGRSAGALGLIAAAGVGAVVLASANFEQAMSRVDAATHETAGNMDLLREAAIKAGADTVFSAGEAADAVTELAKAGVSTKDILGGGLTGALDLASAGELGVAEAATIAATALNQFQLGGQEAGHVADLLAAGAGKAQGEVADMANALKYVGPVANGMKISIEETAGSIAYLASQGIIGEQAGTSLRGILAGLTSPSKAASAELEKLGVQLYDTSGQFVGFDGVAGELQRTMSGLTDSERDQAFGRIFGNEQITAARLLYSGGTDAIKKWTQAVDDDGFAADTASRKLNNLKGDLEALKGSFETALIGAGDGSQGPLRGLVQGATDAVNAFNKLPPAVQGSATALLGITAVTGGALFLGSVVVGRIAATRAALTQLGITATQTRAALTGIGQGIAFAGITIGVNQLSKALNPGVRETDLQRNLSAFANGQAVKDFDKLSAAIARSNSTLQHIGDPFEEIASLGGLVGDTTLDKAKADVEKLDQALAGMVEGGNADEAAAAFSRLAKAAKDETGTSVKDTTKLFDAYTTALKNYDKTADDTAQTSVTLSDGTKAVGTAAEVAAQQVAISDEAMKKLQQSAENTAAEFFGLGASVDDSKVSLDQWIADLGKQEEALRNFTKNAKKAGRRGLDEGLVDELATAGPAGALRLKELANATDKEIRRANKAWRSGQDAIGDYIDYVTSVPDAKVNVDTRQARKELRDILAQAKQIPRTIRTDYIVNQINRANKQSGYGGADGDPNTPYWGGGYTGPGGKYQPAGVVHAGEIVWSQDDIAAWGGPRAVDMMRLSRALPGFANGTSNSSAGGGGYGSVKSELHDYRVALRQSTTAIEKETDKRDDLVSQQTELVDSIKSAFTRDLFGDKPDGFAWMSASDRNQALVGDPLEILKQDIANSRAFEQQLKVLSGKGLDGGAFAALAGTGDLQQVSAFAALSKAQIAEYERLFNTRAREATEVGTYAGSTAFGQDIRSMNKHLAAMNARNARLERIETSLEQLAKKNPQAVGSAVGKAINRAVAPPKRGRR